MSRLTKAWENEIAIVATHFVGLAVGGTREGHTFLYTRTLKSSARSSRAMGLDTATCVMYREPLCFAWGVKLIPGIFATGMSSCLTAERAAQKEGNHYDKNIQFSRTRLAPTTTEGWVR